jgi:MoaA/NifB/PqqE/SkfB family radical SAM enzyme/GT2 family glycosyltransferase
VIWIELTSRCPLRCVFCSRETLRGEGEDLSLTLFKKLLSELPDLEIIRLNYSGESGNYPQLLEAISLAKTTPAQVEMVTALVSMPVEVVARLASSGIDRVTVSCHTVDPERFPQIYGAGSFTQFEKRLALLKASRSFSLDFAMVVLQENVGEIPLVASLAARHGAPALSLHPVIQRLGVPYVPLEELRSDGSLTDRFQLALDAQVTEARTRFPQLKVSIARPSRSDACGTWCEQNPFETAHVLSNGDVVPCEVLDRKPLGNVQLAGFAEVWNGTAYAEFREAYSRGEIQECRQCIFRQPPATAGPITVGWGWYPRDTAGALWSHISCAFKCEDGQGDFVVVRGLLPQSGLAGAENRLTVFSDGLPVASTTNSTAHPVEFTLALPIKSGGTLFTAIVEHGLSPWRTGAGNDSRVLGFALYDAQFSDAAPVASPVKESFSMRRSMCSVQQRAAGILVSSLDWRWARLGISRFPARTRRIPGDELSVVVPERGNPGMLDQCLSALRRALETAGTDAEVVIAVNGVEAIGDYSDVCRRHANCKFVFIRPPLGFSASVSEALRHVRSGWTYLLNSDAILEETAIAEVLMHRSPDIFSIASQIVTLDAGKARETNYTAIEMIDGLVNLIELESAIDTDPVEHAYCGGGSSLFQTDILRGLAKRTKWYDPFYWEDAEWGTIARAMGLRCLFASASRVQHSGSATVSRFYSSSEITRIFERNRIQFQLRCLPRAGLDAVRARIANAPWRTLEELVHPARMANTAAVRARMAMSRSASVT